MPHAQIVEQTLGASFWLEDAIYWHYAVQHYRFGRKSREDHHQVSMQEPEGVLCQIK